MIESWRRGYPAVTLGTTINSHEWWRRGDAPLVLADPGAQPLTTRVVITAEGVVIESRGVTCVADGQLIDWQRWQNLGADALVRVPDLLLAGDAIVVTLRGRAYPLQTRVFPTGRRLTPMVPT